MAEGDSVHRLARRLNGQLVGALVQSAYARTSQIEAKLLFGLTVDEVAPLGKHLLMRFSGHSQLTLHSHLRMQGHWSVLRPGKRLPPAVDETLRLALRLDDGRLVAAINMPVLDLVESRREPELIGHLGPDILSDTFDISVGAARLLQSDRPIIEALLDQRNVCGLGNLWLVETLFLRGVHPDTPAAAVDIEALLKLARKMMVYSRDVVPGMITTGDRRKGRTHWVYGRAGQPCRRCRTAINFRSGDGSPYRRETWWCPSCQPVNLKTNEDGPQIVE